MRCEQFEQRLQRCLDQRRGPSGDPALRRHASVCPQCRKTLNACDRLAVGLDLLELPVPRGEFSQRVVGQVRMARRWPATRRRLTGAVLAVAASLLLGWLPQFAGHDNPVPSGSPRVSAAIAASPVAASATRGPGAVSVGPAVAAQAGLAADGRNSLVPWTMWPMTWSLPAWNPVDQLAGGLTPITAPLGVAVEEIRRTIPLGREERPRASSHSDSVRRCFRRNVLSVA